MSKVIRRKRIHYRVRKRINGTAQRPRLSVHRSNREIYCQLIDDVHGFTLASASSVGISAENRIEQAKQVGKLIAQKALDQNINTVIFDRSGYLYHGRVKALAEGAREGKLSF